MLAHASSSTARRQLEMLLLLRAWRNYVALDTPRAIGPLFRLVVRDVNWFSDKVFEHLLLRDSVAFLCVCSDMYKSNLDIY